jgi:hypothetical protein
VKLLDDESIPLEDEEEMNTYLEEEEEIETSDSTDSMEYSSSETDIVEELVRSPSPLASRALTCPLLAMALVPLGSWSSRSA